MKKTLFIGSNTKICYLSFLMQFFIIALFIICFIILTSSNIASQCTNTSNFPNGIITAPVFSDTVIVSTSQKAGQYYVIKGLSSGDTYVFKSSNSVDYVTIRDRYNDILLTHGNTPLTYTISWHDELSININLQSPVCGSEAIDRTTTIICNTCPELPPNVGIGTITPESDLEVNGILKLGNSNRPELAGMIRWNEDTKDFEGYTGSQWISLTKGRTNWGLNDRHNAIENLKITGSAGILNTDQTGDQFGNSVSISGDYAIVGAFLDDLGFIPVSTNQGSAYIFKRSGDTWIEQAKLSASNGSSGDQFGYYVSITDDYAIVGAPGDDVSGNINQGSAYIFVRNGTSWTEQTMLTGSDGESLDNFGISVSISGVYAIVGAYNDDIGADNNQGSAYIYKRSGSTWTQDVKLAAADGDEDDNFGKCVSIFGGNAIVGVPLDDIGGIVDQGSAYIFKYDLLSSSWGQEAKLTALDGEASDKFGTSVSMSIGGLVSGNYVIVGARLDNVGSNVNQGSAYIYKLVLSSWTEQAKLTASDGGVSDQFGSSVSISGEYVIVGVPLNDIDGNVDQGSAYIFKRTNETWIEQAKLTASDGAAGNQFGNSVSISGEFTIVGAFLDYIEYVDQGSAYLFHK